MTYGQITQEIKEGLNVGGNLAAVYLKRFQEGFLGDKRSITSFKARYNDEGDGVIFEYTINDKTTTMSVEIQKSLWGYKPTKTQAQQ